MADPRHANALVHAQLSVPEVKPLGCFYGLARSEAEIHALKLLTANAFVAFAWRERIRVL